ncbi:hypothetical protein [Saccharicrinis sp. FJH54]|uniref:hypothetical protein n=1 Tax=Saccharicrinis sp. FJH54 TaxID=3344665 RepID=UPI0035D3E224
MDSDNNIGDFIYLILLVVFGVIGAFAKKKKKPVNGPRPASQTRDIFDTLFPSDDDEMVRESTYGNQDDEDYEPYAHKEIKPQPVPSSKSSGTKSTLPGEGMRIHDETVSRKITHTEISDKIKDMDPIKAGEIQQQGSNIDVDLSDPEEIKKAIIYSEILKAKYVN